MSKCKHDFVYAQDGEDFKRNLWKMKCLKCHYKTYSIVMSGNAL
jgi:hypothetical protein